MYPHYAWIIYSWYEERWWTEEIAKEHVDCTDEDMQLFLVRARPLLIQILPEPDDFDLPADPGMVSITDGDGLCLCRLTNGIYLRYLSVLQEGTAQGQY